MIVFSCAPEKSSSPIREESELWMSSYQFQLLNERLKSYDSYRNYKQNIYYCNLCHLWMYLKKDLHIGGLEEFCKERDYESEFLLEFMERIKQKEGVPRLNVDYLLELYFTIWLDCKINSKKDDEKLRKLIVLMGENGYLSLRDLMDPYSCFVIKFLADKNIICATPYIYWIEHPHEYSEWSRKFCFDMIKEIRYFN